METDTAGTPDVTANGSARREPDDRKWPRPVRLLVTVALLPVWAAAILAAENSLNFIGSWFSPVMVALMIVTVIAVWATKARSQR
jgi:K+ transporter